MKVRGYRVELGEIEHVLLSHPAVQRCAVVLANEKGLDGRLIAYIVPAGESVKEPREWQEFLAARLPEYMAPSLYVLLPELPLTPNGKLDMSLLPPPETNTGKLSSPDYVAPRDALEEQLAQIWENVLQVSPIGATSNFFDLGGHSILAVRLMAQVQKRFGQELPLNSLIRASTIEDMAKLVREQTGSLDWSPIVELNHSGSKRPFFCVHPVGGNVLRYRDLARYLGEDQPFYGLEAPGLADDRNHYVLIENLASYYIDAIKRIQATGPYLLGGHSFGGLVAFEMSQQLASEGQKVGLLALIDTPSPLYIDKPTDDSILFSGRVREIGTQMGVDLRISPEEIAELTREEQI
ncbi:MAG: thioesterase domain-containing protein, partial [Blastocatellia bacterium]